jgi:hypothetical protein
VTASEIPGLRADDPCVDHCTNTDTCTRTCTCMAVAEHGEDQVCPFAHVQGGPADGIESLWLECDRRWVSGTSARPSLCRCPSCHEQGELFNPMASHVWNRASRYSHTNMDLADCPKAPLARLQAMTNGPGYCNIEAARLKKSLNATPCLALPRHASPMRATVQAATVQAHVVLVVLLLPQ